MCYVRGQIKSSSDDFYFINVHSIIFMDELSETSLPFHCIRI